MPVKPGLAAEFKDRCDTQRLPATECVAAGELAVSLSIRQSDRAQTIKKPAIPFFRGWSG